LIGRWKACFILTVISLTSCSTGKSDQAVGGSVASSPVLSVAEVVKNRASLNEFRVRIRGCFILMCSENDCYGTLYSDDGKLSDGPNRLQQIAVKNNIAIQRKMSSKASTLSNPLIVIEGLFRNEMYPEGTKRRAGIDAVDNKLVVGPLLRANITEVLSDQCVLSR